MTLIDRKEILKAYGPQGMFIPGSWKEDSDNSFTPNDARLIYHSLSALGYVPLPFERFVLLSPSANVPTHEYAIWQEDNRKRKALNLFITGDLLRLPLDPKYKNSTEGNKQFYSLQAEAAEFPIHPGFAADLIWDRKGWIWYNAYMQWSPHHAYDALQGYKNLLKPSGSIVIDNIEGFGEEGARLGNQLIYDRMIRDFEAGKPPKYRPQDTVLGPVSQYERSTVELINRNIPGLWGLVEDDFHIKDIGEGKHKVRILTKK